jgi:two-component system, NarL family, nitrate/nitrite response regulator NarL
LLIEVTEKRITVLTGDDQPLFGDAVARTVRQRVQFELVAEVKDGRAALEAINRLRPDVAILSLPLEGERVLNAVVRDELPTRVLLLADASAADAAYRAIEHGAAGCLTKAVNQDQLCDAIVRAANGGVVFGGELHTGLAKEIRLRRRDERPVFTERERQVIRLVANGLGNLEIARELHISVATVKTHLAHIHEKLGTSDRAAAVAEAMRRGLLE